MTNRIELFVLIAILAGASGRALWRIDPDSLKSKMPKFMPDVSEVREDFSDY